MRRVLLEILYMQHAEAAGIFGHVIHRAETAQHHPAAIDLELHLRLVGPRQQRVIAGFAVEDFEFEIPVGQNGDAYDRFVVMSEEIRQSVRIIEQALVKIEKEPAGVFHAEAPGIYLPKKQDVYTKMEALIYHFKIVMGETEIPAGEVYSAVEGANGELGFYLISDGGRTPYRLHYRRPCFIYYQAYEELVKGAMLSDAVIVMSSLNLIAGEMDS